MKLSEFKLERYFAKHEFNAPYLLSNSDCESLSIAELLSFDNPQAIEEFHSLRLGYTETSGDPDLKYEIAKLYDKLNKEDIIVFSGAEEGIFCFMNALLEKEDEIIVQFPGYQSLYQIAEGIGLKVIRWKMQERNNWDLNLEYLKDNVTTKTKAIVINNPHNPTGHIMSREFYRGIIDIAKSNDLYLFSDEVYRFSELCEKDKLAPAADQYERAVSLGVMSKSFGLPGLRIGWLGTQDRQLLNKIASFKDYTTICNSRPSEFLAKLALKNRDKILTRNQLIIKKNMKLLDNLFEKYSEFISWVRPKGGTIGFVKLNKSIFSSSEKLSTNLIKNKGVLLVPGTIFDFDDFHFRIGFGRANLDECLIHLKSYFDNIKAV